MNKIITNSTEGNETRFQDMAIRSCQTIQEKHLEQKTVVEKTFRPNLVATEQLLWLARMLSDERALSGFA